jgi:hypothetical protein
MEIQKTLFLVCPIGPENTEIRRHSDQVLKHLVEDTIERYKQDFADINVIRADEVAQPGKITRQIMELLINADICIADLTNLNPNVLYELGIRQAMLRPYILIASRGTKLPFDLQDYRTIFYDLSDIDSISKARDDLRKYIKEALSGFIDPVDEQLFGTKKAPSRDRPDKDWQNRILDTLDSLIDGERSTSSAVESLSQRLTSMVSDIQALFTAGYRGAGSYLFINGEREAFSALVAALSRAKDSIKTTRYSPFAVSSRQEEFAKMIRRRVVGDNVYAPVQSFSRIVAVNNPLKLNDIKEYIRDFLGKRFTLYLTPDSNNFELVIIDDRETFIHFHGRDKIIDSTLHIINEEVTKKFIEIYSSLHDPGIHPGVKKYDFQYISKKNNSTLEEIANFFGAQC